MLLFLLSLLSVSPSMSFAEEKSPTEKSLADLCYESLVALPGKTKNDALKESCKSAMQLAACKSVNGAPIFHVERAARTSETNPKRIIVFSLIHGDELPSGSVARSWMERLTTIEPRNYWRVVPILNPDGLKLKTRTNANGVDINRNFPTKDWDQSALKYWEKKTKKDKRRYPGPKGGSEIETNCAIAHIDDFKPDLILSIHTPYGVLDFDGPKIPPPNFPHIPWKSLGNYPGSLGRYMWVDRSRPTLTIELQGRGSSEKLERFDRLQDITGDIAIQSEKILNELDDPKPEAKSSKKDATQVSNAPKATTPSKKK